MLHVVQEFLLLPTATGGAGNGSGVIPNPPAQMPPGLNQLVSQLVGWAKGLVLGAGVIGLLICSGMMMLGRRNRGQLAIEGVIGGAWVLGGLALASVAAVLVGAFTV
jgi:hypothetical protein